MSAWKATPLQGAFEPSRVGLGAIPTAASASIALMVLQICGILIGLALPHGPWFQPGDLFHKLLSWDGLWYLKIAETGYSWNPSHPSIFQDIAFFPVQGVIDKILLLLCGAHAVAAIILLSFGLGILSIFRFETLARELVGDRAKLATWLYALWPASAFYLYGYPTGLISICVIEALRTSRGGKHWSSAAWLGFGTATAPTVVFVAAGMGIAKLIQARPRSVADLARWCTWCGIAILGLALFIFYQGIALHDPFAFSQAQAAWGKSPSILGKFLRLISPGRYLAGPLVAVIDVGIGAQEMLRGHMAGSLLKAQQRVQILVSDLSLWFAVTGLWRFNRYGSRVSREALLAGWCVCLGYLWFIVGSDQAVAGAARLLFPATAIFLGLSGRRVEWGLILYLGLVSVFEVASVVSGQWGA